MDLEIRFDEAIKNANFNIFEIAGFKSNPHLAIKAGMAIGYKMACDDMLNQKLTSSKQIPELTGFFGE